MQYIKIEDMNMKKILQIVCLALLCLALVFITKARLDLALTIVPESSQSAAAALEGDSLPVSAPEATPEATPEPTPEPEPEYFTISCIGDLTLNSDQKYPLHYSSKMNGDYSYPFANTVQYFADDEITLGNLECSFSDKKLT